MNRRQFIKSLGLLNMALMSPLALASSNTQGRSVILVELKGGNDGLNTLIPYQNANYYQQRPRIALQPEEVLPLNNEVAMHPSLKPLLPVWQEQQMAWIQGVGYDNPNRSHFASIDVWNTALSDDEDSPVGWVSEALNSELKGIAINSSLGPLLDEGMASVSINNLKQFARLAGDVNGSNLQSTNPSLMHLLNVQNSVDELAEQIATKIKNAAEPLVAFPKTAMGRHLESVYTLIASGLYVPAYKVSLGGFDTHIGQKNKHAKNLAMLADALAVLRQNLQYIDAWDNTLVMTYSEFGRRLKENASQGTDHGTAAPHFVMGGAVKGGLYGEYSSLTDLDQRGDLKFTVDFRDLYATIAQDWWGVSATQGKSLGFV